MKYDFSPAILKAGRALTGLNQEAFAAKAEISLPTLRRIEKGEKKVTLETVEKFVRTLEDLGVEYTEGTAEHGAGVRWRSSRSATKPVTR